MAESEVLFVRLYLHEADQGTRKSLMDELLHTLNGEGCPQGVTVFRGIAGIDTAGQVRAADLLHLNADLPLVLEFFDRPDRATAALDRLRGRVPAHHVLTWRAAQSEAPPSA